MASIRDIPHPFPVDLAGRQLDKPFYEKGTDEYKRDLEARRGGLRIGREQDKDEIESLREQIRSGVLPDDQIELYMHRNPGAAGALKVARENRDRQKRLDEIMQGSFRGAQPAFQAAGPVQPGQPRPMGMAQPAQFNAPQAVAELSAAPGGLETAQKVAQMYGVGKGDTSRAAIKYREHVDEETGDVYDIQLDPYSGAVISKDKTGKNVFDDMIPKLAKEVSAAQLPKIVPSVRIIDDFVGKYDEQEAKLPGSGSIPGLGNLRNIKAARFFDSREGKRVRGTIQDIENIQIKQLSGTAVTRYEELRLAIAQARDFSTNAQEWVDAWKERIRPAIQSLAESIKQSVPEGAIKRYESRGGFKFSDFNPPAYAGRQEAEATQEGWTDADEQRLRELESRLGQ